MADFRIQWVDDAYATREADLLRVEGETFVVDAIEDQNPHLSETLLIRADSWVVGCGSCGEDGTQNDECPKSKRPCGHHCNHIWEHDECDWCGKVFTPEPNDSGSDRG